MAAEKKFTYTTRDGSVIEMLSADAIPAGALRRNRNKSEVDFMFSVVEDIMDEDSLEVLDRMPVSEVGELFQKWQAGNDGVALPES